MYLHEVLDSWWEAEVKPRLRGWAILVRYADDVVLAFEHESEARRVMAVLPKRFGRYGLAVHPQKTRLVRFEKPSDGRPEPEQFDLLGFTLRWEISRQGTWVIKTRTAKSRFRRGLKRIAQWCRYNRHRSIREQQRALSRRLHGHYGYFGITGNYEALAAFHKHVLRTWRHWLVRRSHRRRLTWERFWGLVRRFPLPRPRAVHSLYRRAAKA